jgi:hypothetical protein
VNISVYTTPRLNSIPTLDHLTKLLVRLPPLVVHSSWSSRWFLDLPLCCVVSSVPGVAHDLSPGFVPSSVAPKYLMSDIFHWNIHSGTPQRLKITFYKKFCIRLVFCRYLAQFNPSISACFVFVFYSSLRFWWYNYFCTSPTFCTFRSILTSQFANFDISKTFFSISPISRNLAHD